MCTELSVLGNLGDLRAVLGDEIVYEGQLDNPRACLCPLDAEATADLHGMRTLKPGEHGFDPMLVMFVPKSRRSRKAALS
jgi:hypothetical protein